MNEGISIKLYKDKKGKSPYEKWFKKLKNNNDGTSIERRMRLLQTHAHLGDVKFIDQNLYELRFHFGSGYRIYFGKDGNKMIILLMGGDKSSQERDIKKAKTYWKDYLERKNDN